MEIRLPSGCPAGRIQSRCWPGWLLQLLAVPAVMYVLKSAHILEKYDMRPVYVQQTETDGEQQK